MNRSKRKKRRKKILHGMSEVAGQGSYSVMGLRQLGQDAVMAVWHKNPFGYPADINLNLSKDIRKRPWMLPVYVIKMGAFAIQAIVTYDIFHFHFGNSLIRRGLDLFWLKLLGKRVVMEFHGSDIRYCYIREKPKYYPLEELAPFNSRMRRCNDRIMRYVDTVITHDEELRRHIPSKNLFITPLRIDLSKFHPVYPEADKDEVVIVHAPSNYLWKGSSYIVGAVNKLKERYDIEFVLVEGKKQQEAFEYYKRADIIIDQMYSKTYGVFAVESMALGKPVICYITDGIRKTFPKEMPIVSASIDNLETVIERLVQDGPRRRELGIMGRKYVEDYHDYRKVAQVQMDIYERRIKPMSTLESFEYTKNKEIK